jgi:hypothetical protein
MHPMLCATRNTACLARRAQAQAKLCNPLLLAGRKDQKGIQKGFHSKILCSAQSPRKSFHMAACQYINISPLYK